MTHRSAAPLLLCCLAAACASPEAAEPPDRPPAPLLGEETPDADPVADPPPRVSRAGAPTAPVAADATAPAVSGLPSPAGRDATLYVLGGRELTAADLGDFLLRYFPDRAREPLGQLVDEALVEHEARREAVGVAPADVAARAEAYIAERRREVRVQHGEGSALEELLARTLGRTLAEFRRDAERLARVALLRDRLVRLDQRRQERVEVRALTFPDEEEAREAAERLRSGADMTLLARRLGMRPPAAPPPLGRDEITPPARAEEVFAAGTGTVLEPRAFTAPDGSTWWEVVKVVALTPADDRPWLRVREEIEAALSTRPVGVAEYLAWRRRVLARLDVEIRRDGRGLVPWLEAN